MSNEKLVALTGVSGYIAGNLLLQLLKKGYQVNGTVRSLKNKEKISHLMSMQENEEVKKAGGKLKLFEADLEKEGSFKKSFENVSCVFHTASPFHFNIKNADELIKPAVNGTKNVINEAFNSKTVKRIVLTSSVASVFYKKIDDDHVYCEEDWSELKRDSLKDNHDAYCYSKTVAEKTAWELVKELQTKKKNNIDLVCINPSFVFGPPRSNRGDSTSVKYILGLIDGSKTEMEERSDVHCIDVRDVARAHLLAWENKKAKGRYLLTRATSVYRSEICGSLEKEFGQTFKIPKVSGEKQKRRKCAIDRTLELLGGELISLEDSLKDTVNALVKFGFTKDIKK